MIDLAWSRIPGADSYEVQYFQTFEWIDLPGSNIGIAFYGPGAVIRNLPILGSYFRVRAVNSYGVSDWSDFVFIPSTDGPPAWRGVPEPVNSAAQGAPVIGVTRQAPLTLAADLSGVSDGNGLERVRFNYQWFSGDGVDHSDIDGATGPTYTSTGNEEGGSVGVRVSFVDRHGFSESLTSLPTPVVGTRRACPGGGVSPSPVDVAVVGVPIEVASSVGDYFVLYAGHVVGGVTVEFPVLVALGEEGVTVLSESVGSLPVERYRVEKYLVADPADVDGDCVDDITELRAMGEMNPVNSARRLQSSTAAIADHETFERISFVDDTGDTVKFVVLDVNTERPKIYFQNTKWYLEHGAFLDAIGVDRREAIRGMVVYDPSLAASDGSLGVYRYRIRSQRTVDGETFYLDNDSFSLVDQVHTLLAASMPVVDDNLALWMTSDMLHKVQAELPLFRASRVPLVFNEDVYGGTGFIGLNVGEGYGLLRSLEADERPGPRDVVIYRTLPNELPLVAGVISTEPQTPLSHVNLRARQDRIPNAFIAGALEDATVSDLVGRYVHYAVREDGYTIRAASPAEVEEHYAAIRPVQVQVPVRDLSVRGITALGEVGFDDWDSFGVKAANVAVLGTLGFSGGTVPDGFAVPFYFYDEFMRHNDLYDDVAQMLADPDFQSDFDTQVDELKRLRKAIKKAETPDWMVTALEEMHAAFPEGTSLRYRSSTNNEDLPGFNGAGLYDSKTQHPEETEEDGISKSLKQVYASLWNYRAFVERDFHRIDHMAAAMGVLVHPNYSDELVNGVAVSADPAYGTGSYYVNSQVGEDLVTNPEAYSVPEEVLVGEGDRYDIVALSNQVPPGQLLMTVEQLRQLRDSLTVIHNRFVELYEVEDGQRFAMEIEFKITSDDVLAIKQARPWIFALTGDFDLVPARHDGTVITARMAFSEAVSIGEEDMRDHAVAVEGGRVTNARQVDGRPDLWEITITPDSVADVTIQVHANRPCTAHGAICTHDGRRLSTPLTSTIIGPPPHTPGNPPSWPYIRSVKALRLGTVDLEWYDAPGTEAVELRLFHRGNWIDLPGAGAEVAFYGPGAVIKNLPPIRSPEVGYTFRVRSVNSHGVSEWRNVSILRTREPPWLDGSSLVNSPAVGTPVIDGTPQVLETLTADLSGISDGNGLDRVWFGYQWVSGLGGEESDIEGATGPTYALTDSDQGRYIKLRVSFVDRHGFSETLTSLPTPVVDPRPNRPATGDPTVSGTALVGETLTVDTLMVVDEDGLDGAAFGYQWVAHLGATEVDIAGATEAAFLLTEDEEGKMVKVRVSFVDDAGNQEVLISEATGTVASAVAWEGVLTAGLGPTVPPTSGYSVFGGPDGTLLPDGWTIDGTTYGVQFLVHMGGSLWLGLDRELPTDFSLQVGASTYLGSDSMVAPSPGREGVYWWPSSSPDWIADTPIAVSLTVRPDVLPERPRAPVVGYFSEGPWEHDGRADVSLRIAFTEEVVLTADALREHALAVSGGTVSRVRSLGFGGQVWDVWIRPDSSDTVTVAIAADVGCREAGAVCTADGRRLFNRMELVVQGESSISDEVLSEVEDTTAAGSPVIRGSVWVGQTLIVEASSIADLHGLDAEDFGYQWVAADGAVETDIGGAVSRTYTVADADQGKTLKVRVTFADDAGQLVTLTSVETPVVTLPPLTATVHAAPESHDGQPFTFELRFSEEPRPDFSYKTLRDRAFVVEGGRVTNARRLDRPSNIGWEITVSPTHSHSHLSVVLPATENCADPGAVCTADGRMLSGEVSLTIRQAR